MVLLEVRDLQKTYGEGSRAVPAVRGLSFEVGAGETVALVGESGCGKSTTGRVIAGLTAPTAGQVLLDGRPVSEIAHDTDMRRRLQMVFQHPDQSLNPRFRVHRSVEEPLRVLSGATRGAARGAAIDALKSVGLGEEYLRRTPRQLSGGQQQRVAIARALVSNPDLVVLDEPTASLDQSVRARIVSLLRVIQRERNVGYLFISHDLTTVRHIADRVAVMYLGRIVEMATAEDLFARPQHPYTQALLAAAPRLETRGRRTRDPLPGETPSPSELPIGCSFQDRCALVHDRCRQEEPTLRYLDQHTAVECFAVWDELASGGTAGTGHPPDIAAGGRHESKR